MPLYALEDLDDALDVTRGFLTPVDRSVWVKLAVVAFFIGGPGANANSVQYTVGGDGNGGVPPGEPIPGLGADLWLVVAAAVAVALVVALAFAVVGSVMEFVFVESLRTETVTVRRYWSRYWRQGLRLFGFRLVVGLFVLGSVLLLSAPLLLSLFGVGGLDGAFPVVLLVVLVPLFVVLALVAGLVNGFTTVFVVPVMMLRGGGVLAGWRRLWPTVVAHWTQYLAYAVVSFLLSILGGVLVGVVTVVAAVVLLIPFGLLFALGIGALAVAEPVGIGVLVVVGVAFGVTLLAVAALVQVPVQTYLRYYALMVLGDVDADLDLVAEQRAAVRSAGPSGESV
ncbi:hypothetical protein ACFO0N_10080 [Halobium salinum]|uniref:Glycerophosphoryl diester phosphodiesterase membrane domain-containing protein n=1 Tax=Halobium salinum TaxID=1364940 RepID=A0ABD5PC80_9EURY|nr:hypothetical protein [Halobium salinum]